MLDGRARSVWTALLTALIDLDGTEAAGLNRSALGLVREPRRENRRAGVYLGVDQGAYSFCQLLTRRVTLFLCVLGQPYEIWRTGGH